MKILTVNWNKIRKQYFPALKKLTYIMAASASPINKQAYESVVSYYKDMMSYGDIHYDDFNKELETLRELIASYINAQSDEIAFLINTSSGMSIIAHLLDNEKEIIYPSIEFPASIHIFKRMGFSCKKILDHHHSYSIYEYKNALSVNTKYVINSYVQSLTGFRQDLKEIGKLCEENSLHHIVNATQGFSSFEIDVKRQKIDFLTSNGLKWPGAGYGAGILYINREILKKKPIPISGWLSVEDAFQLNNDNMKIINKTSSMDGFGGCPDFGALFALKGSFELIKNIIGDGDIKKGVKTIQERILWLTQNFIERVDNLNLKIITPRPLENRSGIITIEHEEAMKIHDVFIKNKIYVTLKRYPDNPKDTLLRFAFNYYNNLEDIDRVYKILKSINLH